MRMPQELKKVLERLAHENGRGFSDFVQEGLDQWAWLHQPQANAGKFIK